MINYFEIWRGKKSSLVMLEYFNTLIECLVAFATFFLFPLPTDKNNKKVNINLAANQSC